jgi:hypothetical protein
VNEEWRKLQVAWTPALRERFSPAHRARLAQRRAEKARPASLSERVALVREAEDRERFHLGRGEKAASVGSESTRLRPAEPGEVRVRRYSDGRVVRIGG